MSVTTGTFPGVRIVDMPDLGAVTDTSSMVGERAGSGRFAATALRDYVVAASAYPLPVTLFGARGDGVTDDAPAIQAAINAAVARGVFAIYLPSAPVYYLLGSALNLTNLARFTIFGDGCYALSARITPRGSTLAGNTGGGGCIIDATGTSGLVLRNLNLASIGLSNPSTVGLILGNSSTNTNGGSSNHLDNISILLPSTGSSVPLYGVNVNLLTMVKVNTFGDYGFYITNANDLGITRPYGVAGTPINSDGAASLGCFLAGYGTQAPFVLVNCSAHNHDQLYIVNVNASPSFAGHVQAMLLNNCTDVSVKVEIDYFPSAVVQLGAWLNVKLSGLIYAQPSPLAIGVPAVMALEGTSLTDVNMDIRVLSAAPAGTYYYGSAALSSTEISMVGCTFIFDSTVVQNALYLNVTSAVATPIFNCRLNGDSDAAGVALFVNGSAMPASAYRLWVNGLRIGTA